MKDYATFGIVKPEDVNEHVQRIEREKEVLEEELMQQHEFQEELVVQMENLQRTLCPKCSGNQRVSTIQEEQYESSLSNIEMSKSENSLKRPLEILIANT